MISRKGFSLVEMLVAIMTIPLVMAVVTQMVRVILDDMPRDRRVIEEQYQIDQILQQMQTDFDRAQALPSQWQGTPQDANTLILACPQGMVVYGHAGKTFTRTVNSDPNQQRDWILNYAHLTWQPVELSSGIESIQIQSYVPHQRSHTTRQRFARTALFFPGGQR